ncbi:MAG: SDR family NAD(P)-dependent oxidoreductase [Pseudomonadota bacterium]
MQVQNDWANLLDINGGTHMTGQRCIIFGASRGIGAAYAAHLSTRGDEVLSVSRTKPPLGKWIRADLAEPAGITTVSEAVGADPIDAFLFLGGIWEAGAFTDAYEFQASPDAETRAVLSVNLIAPIELIKALLPNLKRSENPRAVFIGSLSGLENSATPEVANTASKFGLRGAAEAMRCVLKGQGVAVSVINPGNVETPEVIEDIATGAFAPQVPIPMADLFAVIDCALAMSPASEIRVLDIAQRGFE